MAVSRYDAIIIGGGHNGLVCGSYLAKAGLKTLVLERRHLFGGAAVTEEFAPGFRGSIFSYVMSILHPRIIADLELRRFGLEVLPANDLFCPLWNDDQLIFSADPARTQANFARFSQQGRRGLPRLRRLSAGLAEDRPPAPVPDPGRPDPHRLAAPEGNRSAGLGIPKDRQPVLSHRRPSDPIRRRLPVAMVRERRDQGRLRLLCVDRHLRRPEDAGLGLRPAAPSDGRASGCRRLGLHQGRHGDDHAGDRSVRRAVWAGGQDRQRRGEGAGHQWQRHRRRHRGRPASTSRRWSSRISTPRR